MTKLIAFDAFEPGSLRDAAYAVIKQRIITCVFKPGEHINEAYVSQLLGIGRTPVHQAFDRLMVDGLVDVVPRKGIIVKPFSIEEFLQIIEVRSINECLCVRLAAERGKHDDIEQLAEVLARSSRLIRARDIERLILQDRAFHGLLARASGNGILADFLANLHDRSLRFWFISLNTASQHENVHEQHRAILTAIRARDPDAAAEAMRAHIDSLRLNLVHTI